jgi:phosphatidylethanolamine/phosphatidyl-N-methylethanolamine N-methyltransferase
MYLFFKQALLNFKQTGALCTSSRFLSKKMTLPLLLIERKKKIIELGPGNGFITKKILNSVGENCELIVFELNTVFCDELKKINDKRLTVINDNATNILKYINSGSVDFIISSLPLAQIDLDTKTTILAQINEVLFVDGSYIQYQYSLLDYYFLKNKFRKIKIGFTFFNLPPAFIYNCKLN